VPPTSAPPIVNIGKGETNNRIFIPDSTIRARLIEMQSKNVQKPGTIKKTQSAESLVSKLLPTSNVTKSNKTPGLSVYKSANNGPKTEPILSKAPEKVERVLSPLETESGMADFLSLDESVRISHLDRLLGCIISSNGSVGTSANVSAISDLLAVTSKCSLASKEGTKILTAMTSNILNTASSNSRSLEGGLNLLQELLKILGRSVEPFAVPVFNKILSSHGDRYKSSCILTCLLLINNILTT